MLGSCPQVAITVPILNQVSAIFLECGYLIVRVRVWVRVRVRGLFNNFKYIYIYF